MSQEGTEQAIAEAIAAKSGDQEAQKPTDSDSDAITSDALMEALMPSEPDEEETTPAAEDPAPEPEAEEPATLLEQLAPEGLSKEQKEQLAKEIGSNLGDDLGKLRQETRELRAALEQELTKREPFEREPSPNNPYKGVSSLEELKDTYHAAQETIRSGNTALKRNSDAAADEVVMTLDGGRELTRSEVENMVETAEEARDFHIPDRIKQLRQGEEMEAQKAAVDRELAKLHPWIAEEGNETRQLLESEAPRLEEVIREHLPELYPRVRWVLANHYAWIASQKGAAKSKPRIKPADTPPSSPSKAAASSSRPADMSQTAKAAQEAFLQSGSSHDLTKFLAAKKAS